MWPMHNTRLKWIRNAATHLKWSCKATLKSNESPRSANPRPIKAWRPVKSMTQQWTTFTTCINQRMYLFQQEGLHSRYRPDIETSNKEGSCWECVIIRAVARFLLRWKNLTVSILYPNHKISARVRDSFHNTTWILCDRSLGKQLSCQEIIHSKQCRRGFLSSWKYGFLLYLVSVELCLKHRNAVKCSRAAKNVFVVFFCTLGRFPSGLVSWTKTSCNPSR